MRYVTASMVTERQTDTHGATTITLAHVPRVNDFLYSEFSVSIMHLSYGNYYLPVQCSTWRSLCTTPKHCNTVFIDVTWIKTPIAIK